MGIGGDWDQFENDSERLIRHLREGRDRRSKIGIELYGRNQSRKTEVAVMKRKIESTKRAIDAHTQRNEELMEEVNQLRSEASETEYVPEVAVDPLESQVWDIFRALFGGSDPRVQSFKNTAPTLPIPEKHSAGEVAVLSVYDSLKNPKGAPVSLEDSWAPE